MIERLLDERTAAFWLQSYGLVAYRIGDEVYGGGWWLDPVVQMN